MSEAEWLSQFHPKHNHINPDRGYEGFDPKSDAGCLFDTSGEDYGFIRSILRGEISGMSEANIWSVIDGSDIESDPDNIYAEYLMLQGCEFDESESRWMKDGVPLIFNNIVSGDCSDALGYLVTREPVEAGVTYEVVDDEIILRAARMIKERRDALAKAHATQEALLAGAEVDGAEPSPHL